jgi:hypothetical protein
MQPKHDEINLFRESWLSEITSYQPPMECISPLICLNNTYIVKSSLYKLHKMVSHVRNCWEHFDKSYC